MRLFFYEVFTIYEAFCLSPHGLGHPLVLCFEELSICVPCQQIHTQESFSAGFLGSPFTPRGEDSAGRVGILPQWLRLSLCCSALMGRSPGSPADLLLALLWLSRCLWLAVAWETYRCASLCFWLELFHLTMDQCFPSQDVSFFTHFPFLSLSPFPWQWVQ